jgi:hypothetical protein
VARSEVTLDVTVKPLETKLLLKKIAKNTSGEVKCPVLQKFGMRRLASRATVIGRQSHQQTGLSSGAFAWVKCAGQLRNC